MLVSCPNDHHGATYGVDGKIGTPRKAGFIRRQARYIPCSPFCS